MIIFQKKMKLSTQKRIAAKILNKGKSRVSFLMSALSEIKEAITRGDIRKLAKQGAISEKHQNMQSRARARKSAIQKSKGRQKGHGSRKGKKFARTPRKLTWMFRIRLQRKFLNELKEKELISSKVYHMLRQKAKGGFFRSKRHIKVFLEEHNLVGKKDIPEEMLKKPDLETKKDNKTNTQKKKKTEK